MAERNGYRHGGHSGQYRPNQTNQLTSFEAPSNQGDNFGERLRGYICAPETGNYSFWIASDNESDLYLSTDANPANKVKIAFMTGYAAPRIWTKYPTQKSVLIPLIAGTKYYIEALTRSNSGDNLAVGWNTPSMGAGATPVVIPGSVLSPVVPPAT